MLPVIEGIEINKYVLKIYNASDELIFAIRLYTEIYQPSVFEEGNYRIEIWKDEVIYRVVKDTPALKENMSIIKLS